MPDEPVSRKSWHPDIFETLYRQRPDPWDVTTSPYEKEKCDVLLSTLPDQPIEFALELGCSIGGTTEHLAPRCARLLAVDAAETALAQARTRCEAHANIIFLRAFLPDEFPCLPRQGCHLAVVSELLYFLDRADIETLAARLLPVLAPQATVLTVNWTGPTDTPTTGEEAARIFQQALLAGGLCHDTHLQAETYRLDRFRLGSSLP